MRPSSAAVTYSAVKDQLVSLSLEIEDCSQAADLLREALDREQAKAKDLTQDVGAPFQDELDAADAADKKSLAQHLQLIDELLERKRELSAQAKRLLEQIKGQQAETAIAVEEVRERGKAEILDAQALWAQGEDLRREKWMARQTKEIRELTLKGLEPEIERIMDKHKTDMEDIERGHHREAQRLRQQTSLRVDEALSEERARVRCRVEQARREAMEAISEAGRRQALTDKHQADLERARKRAAGEAETQRRWQEEEMRRMEGVSAADITRLRNEEHSRLQEMRLKHAEDVDKASRRRVATLASLTRQAELDREDWARRAKEGASAGGEESLRVENQRLLKERNNKLDAAVRRIRRDRIEHEEASQAEAEKEERRVNESHARAKRLLAEKLEQWEQRHAECTDALYSLVETRRELALKSRELTAEEGLLSLRARKVETSNKDGASAARDEEARNLKEHQELMSESRLRRAELEQKIKDCNAETAGMQARSRSESSRLREEQDELLEALHKEVQAKVASQDEDISSLREAVHTESLRADHASKMLAKYVKRAAAAADAAAGSVAGAVAVGGGSSSIGVGVSMAVLSPAAAAA
ncbi:unnamed protein product, partial [Pylaiella littoralis]